MDEMQPVPETVVEEPVKKPRVKERTLEELDKAPVKSMSEKEVRKYVDHLRDTNAALMVQLESMREAFQGVQTQKQQLEQKFTQYQIAANTQIQFCKDTLAQAFKAVHYMQSLEV